MKHFRTFEKFLLENAGASSLTEDQINWCKEWMGDRWIAQSDGEILVQGDVTLSNMKEDAIPVQFGDYVSAFTLKNCGNLKTLKGCPGQTSNFNIINCPSLRSLEGSPKSVYSCDIHKTAIKNLIGMPSDVKWMINCEDNLMLESLEGCSQTKISNNVDILEYFIAINCPRLKTIFGAPLSEIYKVDTENISNPIERKWLEEKDLEMIHLWLSSKLPIDEFLEKKKGLLSAKKFGL